LETSGGHIVYGIPHGRVVGRDPVMSVRTVHLRLSFEAPAGTRNIWPVRVHRSVFQGDLTQVHVTWGDRELVVRRTALDPIPEGQNVYLSVDPHRCIVLETE